MTAATPPDPTRERPSQEPSMGDLDHSDTGPNIIAAAFTTWTIALVFVLLRFYTRSRLVKALGLTDWFVALALVAAGGMCISQVEQVKRGTGKHIWDVPPENVPPMMEAWWFSLLFYILALALTKVSICLLYRTIFTYSEWARRACYAVLFIVVVTNLWAVGTTLTYCIPLQATWDLTAIPWFCQSQDAWWANTGLTIATDIIIFILPIPMVLPLKLPLRQKIVVVGIFAIGFFVCLVSLIRLAILIQKKGSTDADFTYNGTQLTYWTVIEVHTAIVVACAMTLKPLVTKFFPRLLAADRRRGGGSDDSKDESSGVSGSEPPLTIGSKPSRQQRQDGLDAMVVGAVVGDVEGGLGSKSGGGHVQVQEEEEAGEKAFPASDSGSGSGSTPMSGSGAIKAREAKQAYSSDPTPLV